jgi:hypothetical protein
MELSVIVLLVLGIAVFLFVEGVVPIAPSSTVQRIAKAIAKAEGFYVSGSVPSRAHNPGDLKLGDKGYGTIDGKTIFPSDSQGWQALYHEVQLILDGKSAYYQPSMSIADIGNIYSGGDPNWAQNVADDLGVDVDTQIGQVTA